MADNSTFTLTFEGTNQQNIQKQFRYDGNDGNVIGDLNSIDNTCDPCWQKTRKTQEFENIVDSLSQLKHIEPNWRNQIHKKGGKSRKTRRKKRRN